MGRQRNKRLFKRGERIELEIIDLAFGGKGISKIATDDGDFVCFVENTLPGQKVLAAVHKCKKKHAECRLVEVLKKSSNEVEIPYQLIPGAPYAQLPIKQQEENKKNTCFQLFKRIGHLDDIEAYFDEFISSPSAWHYRNKMEYSFSAIRYDFDLKKDVDDFAFGFKHRGTWWMVENLDKDSGLFDTDLENAFPKLRAFFEASSLSPWHPPKKEGFYRFLVARKSYANNQILLNLVTTSTELSTFDMQGFIELLKEILGARFAGLLHTVNDSIGDRIQATDGSCKLVYGEEKIIEQVLGLNFEISMQSFFQTNPKCAEKLYQKVVDYVLETDEEQKVIMDLFCGTGTIGQILAYQIPNTEVIGVDIVPEAIEDAIKNADRNCINGLKFFAADVGKFLQEYPQYTNNISTVVLDPPRAGIAPKTLKKVVHLNASRIVYVSCNPATQARDTEYLISEGYQLKKISFVDQFPHTSHVESIALFEKGIKY
jgi:23S rRNA (uracil-5-)-methyltransferase RumA